MATARALPDDPKALYGAMLALQIYMSPRYEQGYRSVATQDWHEYHGAAWLLAATPSRDPAVTRARLIYELNERYSVSNKVISPKLLTLSGPLVKSYPEVDALLQSYAMALATSFTPADWPKGDEMIRQLALKIPKSLAIVSMPFIVTRFRYLSRRGPVEDAQYALQLVPGLRRRLPANGTLATYYLPFAVASLEAVMRMRKHL